MTDQNEQLLPCPFCGGTHLSTETSSIQPDNFHDAYIYCVDCEAQGRRAAGMEGWLSSKDEAKAEAVIAWNRRAPAAAPAPVAASVDTIKFQTLLGTYARAWPDPFKVLELRAPLIEYINQHTADAVAAALAAAPAPAAAPIVQPVADELMPPVELKPRRPDDESEPDVYLESDRAFFANNSKLVRWYLENDEAIRAALAAPTPASSTADAKDAARYRWLRHGDNDDLVLQRGPVDPNFVYLPRNAKLDEMIDAAITSSAGEVKP